MKRWLFEPYRQWNGDAAYPGPIPITCNFDAILLFGGLVSFTVGFGIFVIFYG